MYDISIGRINNTHGIKGELRISPETDFAEERFRPGQVVAIVDKGQTLYEGATIQAARFHKGIYIVKFEDFDDINQVEVYKGARLMISEADLPDLEEGEYYHHQLLGLEVVTSDGQSIGQVKEVLNLPANDVFVVKRPKKQQQDALIPHIHDIVKDVDLDQGQIIIELMEGLIDDED